MALKGEWIEVSLCEGCRLASAGYDAHELGMEAEEYETLLSKLGADVVSDGTDWHKCPYHDGQDEEHAIDSHGECDVRYVNYGSRCDGCGTMLGGNRYSSLALFTNI